MERLNLCLPNPPISIDDISPATPQLLSAEENRQLSLYRGQLEERVLVLRWEIEALKHRHNAIAPVSRLPAEILGRIFTAVRTASMYTPPLRNRARWIGITHVCRHWRAVGLDCVSLWLDLEDFMHPALMREIVTRSKNAPLSLRFYIDDIDKFHGVRTTLQRVLSMTGKLRHLDLAVNAGNKEHLQQIISYCSTNAPVLETLSLSCHGHTRIVLPPGLQKGGAPSIRKLQVDLCGIPWGNLPLADTLTELSLSDGRARSGKHRPALSEFFSDLQQMRSIRTLNLFGYLPTSPTTCPDAPAPSPLEFPALETLSLHDYAESINTFFQTIYVPSSTQIRVNLLGRVQDETSLGQVIQNIAVSWGGTRDDTSPRSKRPRIRCVELDDSTDLQDNQASLWTRTSFEGEDFEWDNPDLGLDFRNDGRFTACLLRHITRYLDLGALYYLGIKGTGWWCEEDWLSLSDYSRNLATVRIDKSLSGLTGLLDVLSGDTSTDSLCFHRLEKLELVDLDMEICDPDDYSPAARLTDVLEWREAKGYPIFELELENCPGFDKSHLQALLRLPSLTVGWDGDGGYRRYSQDESSEEGSGSDETGDDTGDEVSDTEIGVEDEK